MIPWMEQIIKAVADMATEYADLAMLSRTHGQPASPTTLGKEMANFAYHLSLQKDRARHQTCHFGVGSVE